MKGYFAFFILLANATTVQSGHCPDAPGGFCPGESANPEIDFPDLPPAVTINPSPANPPPANPPPPAIPQPTVVVNVCSGLGLPCIGKCCAGLECASGRCVQASNGGGSGGGGGGGWVYPASSPKLATVEKEILGFVVGAVIVVMAL